MRYKLEVFSTKFTGYSRLFDRKRDLLEEVSSQLLLIEPGDFIAISLDDQVDLPVPVEALHEEILCVPAE